MDTVINFAGWKAVTMADEDREGPNDRRSGIERRITFGEATDVIDRSASKIWKWATMLVPVVCTIFLAGGLWFKFRDVPKSIDTLGNRFTFLEHTVTEQARITSLNTQAIVTKDGEIRDLRQQLGDLRREKNDEIREVRGQIDNIRGMREAYVWSAGNAALRKNPSIPPPP